MCPKKIVAHVVNAAAARRIRSLGAPGLAWDVNVVAAKHLLEALQRYAVCILRGQQRQYARASLVLFNQLCRLVGTDHL